ncbi:E3 ubiquitin-protein ligase Topors-like isoform X2 [Sphaeramia orbicularis]|uniref:E3 ubiquitin-protein ligase Topors-like isoform X2 n=1 Tax=Sphaeramia orbicularis TaxID=375764 RepID=UPI00117BEE3C|nr:E3 ubiquitin-protein ligase Topors-like isoform X2 [Sphaeramia orbicularis]
MAPTRMKLRVRRRDNAVGGSGVATGSGQPEEEEEGRNRESGGGRSSRRKSAPAAPSSSPPTSSAAASARAALAAEEASPDSKCPICLDRFNNLAYLDRCLHRFCFPCIQEWSHNKAECPLCKQPFASILHSVRAEDDFKEYTLHPPPGNGSVAATVAMVAAMAARSEHQIRLMLRRHRAADGSEATARRRRRERGSWRAEQPGVWEWYLDSPPLHLPPFPQQPAASPLVDSEDGEGVEEQRRGGTDVAERGVIFEGLTGLGGAAAPLSINDRASRRLMTRLAARQRLQREGGTVRRLRERETVAFRRALYRSGIWVCGVAMGYQGQQQRDITAESFRRNPAHLNRLRPWLRRELTVLYGAHNSLVSIVQRIIMARLARHGLEDTPTIEEELRPFLLARTDHFLHELVNFARSPLSLDSYDLQAVYEPPATAMELDGVESSSDSSSVIAISEGEEEMEEEREAAEGRLEPSSTQADVDDVIQTGSCLSLTAWDDETPGPSYSSAEPSCLFSPAPQEGASEERVEKQQQMEGEEEEEECLIVGYKKPIAERTPELVQLSSDTEEEKQQQEEEEKKKEEEKTEAPPLTYVPTIPPSTSGAFREERVGARARSWSGSSGRSHNSSKRRRDGERKHPSGEAVRRKREQRRKKRRSPRRRQEKSGTLYNPNRSIFPAAMLRHSRSPSPFDSSVGSSCPDSDWEYSHVSPLISSPSLPSRSSSSFSSSPLPSPLPPQTPATPSDVHSIEKPGGKRKYKSRHLDSNDRDPTWKPSGSQRRERKEKRRRDDRRRRDPQRESGGYNADSRRDREERSPSVEIIYEGTITSDTQPHTRKRRRKRRRRAAQNSSPVIITLDSDSSQDDVIDKPSSSCSSPFSSQQTIDFSDLPPLPLVHSTGVGGALDAEIGELPVDILDRGSDRSETEPACQSKVSDPISVDNSDDSDADVDVERLDNPGLSDGPIKVQVDGRSHAVGGRPASLNRTDLPSDRRLLATILNDLEGLAVPKCDRLNSEPGCHSPDAKSKPVGGTLSFESTQPFVDKAQQPDLPLSLPALHRDAPPLLKQTSPVRSYNRNTPPPLKHKDDSAHSDNPAEPGSRGPPANSQTTILPSSVSCSLTSVAFPPAPNPPPVNSCTQSPDLSPHPTESTSGGLRSFRPASCPVSPVDLHPASSTAAGSDAFSGVSTSDTSPAESRTQTPPTPTNSEFATNVGVNLNSRVDPLLINHSDRSPHLNCDPTLPPLGLRPRSPDAHLNHTGLSLEPATAVTCSTDPDSKNPQRDVQLLQ